MLALVGAAADRARDLDLVVPEAVARVPDRDLEALEPVAVQAEQARESRAAVAAELPENG